MAGKNMMKLAILSLSFVVLVAMVIGLIVTVNKYSEEKPESTKLDEDVKASIKAVCENTDYKRTCVESLSGASTKSTNPYDHIKTMFEITIKQLDAAVKNSSFMNEIHRDPRTNDALKGCKELAGLAVMDLRRAFDKMSGFSLNEFGQALVELKIWMSGAITYEQTCLDGFEKTQGNAGEKMKKALKKSMELTSNCLAMTTDISQALQEVAVPQTTNRRLLTLFSTDYNIPEWVDATDENVLEKTSMKIDRDLTVAQDGSGDFESINEALKFIPVRGKERYVMYIKEGIYKEIVQFPKNLTHIMIIGDGPSKTRITGNLNFIDGVTTYHTATVAGPEKHQAVALRVSADRAIFYNCHMDGYQDTLYVHTYRQFYRDCTISGTIDFLFGDSAVVFQNCIMVVRKPMDNQNCIVTAQGRKENRQPTGIVLQNCSIVADPVYFPVRKEIKSYLGRPWKQYSRTIIMESFIDDLIQPQGWLQWNQTFAFDTLFYTEFNNHGPGSSKLERVQWPGVKELPASRIKRFTPGKFITGDSWIPPTGVPYTSDFIYEPPKDDPKNDYSKKSNEEDRDYTPTPEKEKKQKKPKKKKKPKKEKDESSDKQKAPAEGPSSMAESEISAPYASPAQPPSQGASPTPKNGSFLRKVFGLFTKSNH
ncbi:Pectinesterase, catalytic [Cynara cardunculus var. scolymus]|uniref:pectinesterase n=1 Tax=Cynara cardunculus var. scolymus TaxID=59895 RepID=A0A103XBZ9_CYNCS|nr:Pectinesterase, catalytic [Cynara cardunculus var. scolymus]